MTKIFVAEEHSQLHDLWIERGDSNLSVCHVDFHCDMRGLLIDRSANQARYVWQSDPYMNRLDSGSFLAHAIMMGIVNRLCWVHDDYGGRKYDDLYCVKYETDFTSLPFRLGNRKAWVSIDFNERIFRDWEGPGNCEHLSIDWDGLAYVDYDRARIKYLMNGFLGYECCPELVFVSRSQEYVYPDKGLFDEFVHELEKKFATRAVYLSPKKITAPDPRWYWTLYHLIEYRLLRVLRKFSVY